MLGSRSFRETCGTPRSVPRLASVVVTALLLAGAAYGMECKDDPEVVGRCFKVHGRFGGTASGRIELAAVGRDPLRGRVMQVDYSNATLPQHHERPWMPEELRRIEADEDFYGPRRMDVYGDFEVCRLEPDVSGIMRRICIQSAERLVVIKGR
jgi:hypothetical protein